MSRIRFPPKKRKYIITTGGSSASRLADVQDALTTKLADFSPLARDIITSIIARAGFSTPVFPPLEFGVSDVFPSF